MSDRRPRQALGEQYTGDTGVRKETRNKREKAKRRRREYLDAVTSQKIIDQARQQLEEEDIDLKPSKADQQHPEPRVEVVAHDDDDDDDDGADDGADPDGASDEQQSKKKKKQAQQPSKLGGKGERIATVGKSRKGAGIYLRQRFEDGEDLEDDKLDDVDLAGRTFQEQMKINAHDEAALNAFMPEQAPQRMTLADLIMEKIQDNKTEIQSHLSELNPTPPLPHKIVSLYRRVGEFMSRYKSGKMLKAVKRMPAQPNWEELMYLTQPETWSAASMYQVTRLFSSNLNAKKVQRFYNLVLLPRVRDDIAEYRKLNYHLYRALMRALFKPRAFYLGIVLPLCQSGDCTLKEAVIIGSVLAKKSIPGPESAAAMIKIAELPYTGASSIFLRVLIDKKYALPYRVIDALVAHFVRSEYDKRRLPTLWHQCLLVFVQRYRHYISDEQKVALRNTIKVHRHAKITPVILHALQAK